MYISDPLVKVAKACRNCGYAVMVLGLPALVITLALSEQKHFHPLRALSLVAMFVGSGAAMVVLAGVLQRGSLWAYYALLGLSIIMILVALPFTCGWLSIVFLLPFAACLNAWREVRFLERGRRAQQSRQHGFQPVMPPSASPPPMVLPPRPLLPPRGSR